MTDDNETIEEWLNKYTGKLTKELCPECKEPLLKDFTEVKWCSSRDCGWSNDKKLAQFIKALWVNKT